MVLGTDLGGGNVDISLVLKVFLKRCVFVLILCFFFCFSFCLTKEKTNILFDDFGG